VIWLLPAKKPRNARLFLYRLPLPPKNSDTPNLHGERG
jgi:hypothetical protein